MRVKGRGGDKPVRVGILQPIFTQEQKILIHEGLKILAECDGDGATKINGVGFNKFDVKEGHYLASLETLDQIRASNGWRIIRKYTKQIPVIIKHIERIGEE